MKQINKIIQLKTVNNQSQVGHAQKKKINNYGYSARWMEFRANEWHTRHGGGIVWRLRCLGIGANVQHFARRKWGRWRENMQQLSKLWQATERPCNADSMHANNPTMFGAIFSMFVCMFISWSFVKRVLQSIRWANSSSEFKINKVTRTHSTVVRALIILKVRLPYQTTFVAVALLGRHFSHCLFKLNQEYPGRSQRKIYWIDQTYWDKYIVCLCTTWDAFDGLQEWLLTIVPVISGPPTPLSRSLGYHYRLIA